MQLPRRYSTPKLNLDPRLHRSLKTSLEALAVFRSLTFVHLIFFSFNLQTFTVSIVLSLLSYSRYPVTQNSEAKHSMAHTLYRSLRMIGQVPMLTESQRRYSTTHIQGAAFSMHERQFVSISYVHYHQSPEDILRKDLYSTVAICNTSSTTTRSMVEEGCGTLHANRNSPTHVSRFSTNRTLLFHKASIWRCPCPFGVP